MEDDLETQLRTVFRSAQERGFRQACRILVLATIVGGLAILIWEAGKRFAS